MKLPIHTIIITIALMCNLNSADEHPNHLFEEDSSVSVKIEDLEKYSIRINESVGFNPDLAFNWLFSEIKSKHKIIVLARINEQENPISFSRWSANRFYQVKIEKGDYTALQLFNLIISQSRWHWSYARDGAIIINAWHQGEMLP